MRTQAEEYISKIKTEAKSGRLNLPKGRKVAFSLAEAANQYLSRLTEEGGKDLKMKRQRFQLHLLPFMGKHQLSRLSSFDLERYKKSRLDAGAAKGTINRELAALSHLFTKAEDWRWIDRRPVRIKRLQEDGARLVYLTPEQARDLVAAAANDQNSHIHAFIMIALETTMRMSEVLSIRKEYVDLPQPNFQERTHRRDRKAVQACRRRRRTQPQRGHSAHASPHGDQPPRPGRG